MKKMRESVGTTIARVRKSKKITQQQLASLLEVDRQYIWRLEHGKVNLTMDYLDKILAQLECSPKEFCRWLEM